MNAVTKPRIAYEVYINDKSYDVWDLEGKQEHPGHNGTSPTYWIYYSDRLPEGVAPPLDSEHWHAYCVGVKRLVWDIRIKDRITTKLKWGDLRFSNHTSVEMWCNGKHLYSFMTGDTNFALAKAQTLMVLLFEHPYSFLNQEKEVGRKIQYYGLPALIGKGYEPGEINIVPDYSVMKKVKWWKEYRYRQDKSDEERKAMEEENIAEYEQSDLINHGDAFGDGKINWFRSED